MHETEADGSPAESGLPKETELLGFTRSGYFSKDQLFWSLKEILPGR
jgi:hypothetical protein